jgi:uncharacterized DUF497 family protein
VAITWDPAKAKSNAKKHGIRFPDAVHALDDPRGITVIDDDSEPTEQRFATLGLDSLGGCWWWFTRGAAGISG